MKKLLCAAMFLAACSDPVASGPVRIEPSIVVGGETAGVRSAEVARVE